MVNEKLNVLFICSRNQWRSPTAEQIYRNDPRLNVRSAGLSDKSKHKLSTNDLEWADLIMVMEKKHRSRISTMFRNIGIPDIVVLNIEDDYQYMAAELIQLLRQSIEPVLNQYFQFLKNSNPPE